MLLSEDLKLPGYNRVVLHRSRINLADEVKLIYREFPVGVGISNTKLLTHTVERIVSAVNVDDINYPLKVNVSNGLDRSGCHPVYQQVNTYPELSTKTFLLFGFKMPSSPQIIIFFGNLIILILLFLLFQSLS